MSRETSDKPTDSSRKPRAALRARLASSREGRGGRPSPDASGCSSRSRMAFTLRASRLACWTSAWVLESMRVASTSGGPSAARARLAMPCTEARAASQDSRRALATVRKTIPVRGRGTGKRGGGVPSSHPSFLLSFFFGQTEYHSSPRAVSLSTRRVSCLPTCNAASQLPILLVFPTVGILFADMVHNLSVCVQFKGGMSNWRDLFVGVADAKSDLDPHYSWLFSRTGTRAARIDHGIESFYASRPDWLHVRVLRDPVERMASGFLDWCVRRRSNTHCHGHYAPSFTNLSHFARHHMDTRFNGHFIPQNTGCNTYKRFSRLIVFGSSGKLTHRSSPSAVPQT